MKTSQAKKTTAENLEGKFDRGENVLDYFEVRKARAIVPHPKVSRSKEKFAYAVKHNSTRRAVIREKSARYRKRK